MSTRTSDVRLARFTVGLGVGAAIALALALTAQPAKANIFGKKQPKEDFSAVMPTPTPVQAPPPANGAIFQAAAGYAALYEGHRARRVGDPLTIVLVERTAASKSATSKLDSSGGGGLELPNVGPLSIVPPGSLQANGSRGFTGGGTADQANSLVGEISVTVAEVYPNGTMLVQGEKRVTLNRGDEYIRIKGLVRVADIDADNRVASTRVADARIAYTGKGDVARAARQGWFSRFFQMLSPF